MSSSGFAGLGDPSGMNSSLLHETFQLLSTSKTASDVAISLEAFEDASKSISQSGEFTSSDLAAYQQIVPLFVPLLNGASGDVLIRIMRGIEHLVEASNSATLAQSKAGRHPLVSANSIKGSRVLRLLPLAPLKDASAAKEGDNKTSDHFHAVIAKVLYKMSASRENDRFFNDESMIARLIALASERNRIGTRTYAVAALRNEASSPEFRARLACSGDFVVLCKILSIVPEKVDLFVHLTGLFRNLIADVSNLELLIANQIHVSLFSAMNTFPSSAELVFNCFRILTKISDRDSVRRDIIDRYSADGLLTQLLMLVDKHKENSQILNRLFYVFADFAAFESDILMAASHLKVSPDISAIPDCLKLEKVKSDRALTAMVVQVIANLSVDEACASILMRCDFICDCLPGCTFGGNDRLGFNLLCAASNFTYHDRSWCPAALIAAIPVAIVSKTIPSILEALRTLCNLALAPNALLLQSKIPDMLVLLLKHIHPDVVLYSLQTLTNLANHAVVRKRFQAENVLHVVLDLFSGEEMDEVQLEAMAALVLNIGAMAPADACSLGAAFAEYELDRSNPVIDALIEFLNETSQ
jgi:hypothetical protein